MDSREKKDLLAFWILPAKSAREFLQTTTAKLAADFDAPIFEPHVTIFVTQPTTIAPLEIIETVFANEKPIALSIRGIHFSDRFTKTLFIEFEPDARLQKISDNCRKSAKTADNYPLQPHLSLLYKTMPAAEKQKLASTIQLPFSQIGFDRAKAILCPREIRTSADVESWQTVADFELAS